MYCVHSCRVNVLHIVEVLSICDWGIFGHGSADAKPCIHACSNLCTLP